jgi:hypothetical protein
VSILKAQYPNASVSDQSATLTRDFSPPSRPAKEKSFLAAAKHLLFMSERQAKVEQIAERIDAAITLESESMPMPNDPETGEPMMAPNAPVIAMRFHLEGRLPSSALALLSKDPGMVFQRFETDLKTGKSTIEGVMYGRVKNSNILR